MSSLKYIVAALVCLLQLNLLAQSLQRPEKLVLATYTYSTNNRLNNLKPLAEYLQAETGIPITAESYGSVRELVNAMREGKVDLAVINTLGYLAFKEGDEGIATPLVNLQLRSTGVTNYGGCILATKQSGIRSLDDILKGSKYSLALVNNSSTSGNLVPRLLLNSKGIAVPEQHFNLYYAGTHKQVIDDLLSGKTVLGGCGCYEYDKNVQADKTFADKIVKVAEFNDIPLGPVMYDHSVPAEIILKLKKAFLEAHEKNPDVFRNFCAGWSEFREATKFQIVSDTSYDGFRALFTGNRSLWKLLLDGIDR